ncbi:MAG TPA: serine hydrolase domain-containing protein [Jatrophihabitantaceae bacterium]
MNLDIDPGFSGVVSVSRGERTEFERAYGLADRPHAIPAAVDTQFAIASGSKAFTALAVVSLIADGTLRLERTARSLLGDDLPLIADDVTVEHLLAHRSGIGDYVDEDLDETPLPTVPVQDLAATADFIPALDGFPTKFAAGTRFSYCNSGYVVLALLAERASGVPYHDLVAARVTRPAGMTDTAYLRSDELPGRAAICYLDNGRTNVFALPVRGNGDGGAYSTVADIRAFWAALFAGRIVPDAWVARMVDPRSDAGSMRYGLGFWLAPHGPVVAIVGADHGVSFRSVHDPSDGLTWTVISNSTDGAWPVARRLREMLGTW